MSSLATSAVGAPVDRREGREKVTGQAVYAYEHAPGELLYAVAITASIARGRIAALDPARALEHPGVEAVLWHAKAPRLHEVSDAELAILQSPEVAYRGQIIGAAVATGLEAARHAAGLVAIDYAPEPHDVLLRADHPRLYTPETVNPGYPTDTAQGDFERGFAAAPITVDATYSTPAFHNNPMEPHACVAMWEGGRLTVFDSTQGATPVGRTLASAFGLEEADVRVVSPHVGGGFGSKGTPRPHVILAVMAARLTGRPVKLAVTRQQMFAVTGYRTPTIQRMRLGADRDGRLIALAHDVVEQTSTLREFAEQTAVPSRNMYRAENLRTSHRLVRLDVPTPSWMRAPGECPGMYALEAALDELAVACGVDPIELRVRNEPEVDPESGRRFSSRNLVACLREGAERFGWAERDPTPAVRRDGPWAVGTGVASSTYPSRRRPCQARAQREAGGGYVVALAAADIGTGARTALAQIAADVLEVPLEAVRVELGDSGLPAAPLAGGSMGTASWGSAVVKACRELRAACIEAPDGPVEVEVDTTAEVEGDEPLARFGFGAQFVEARVNTETGEIRIPRALGVFAVGRIINPKTARSQLIGGMTMGIGMALHEESILDREFGDYLNHDLATYHVPSCADIEDVEAVWVPEDDPHVNPMGAKGIGEIGIVGTAAAVAAAVHHATGARLRELPLSPDRVLAALRGAAPPRSPLRSPATGA